MTRTYTTLALTTLAALGLAAALPQGARAQGVFDFDINATTHRGPTNNPFSGSLGVQFTVPVGAPVVVSALGFYAPAVTQDAHSVGIFDDATKSLVGSSVTFAAGVRGADPSTAAGSFVYLPDTIVLLPGTYTLEANYPSNGGFYSSNDRFDEVSGVINNDPAILTYKGGAYEDNGNPQQGATLDYAPYGPTGGGYFGANLELAAAPEPSQFAALGLGVLGLGALALKARKRAV